MVDKQEHMLSTSDNPFNPSTEWDRWYAWDEMMGYHSSSLLARVSLSSPELSLSLMQEDIEDAIDEIVRENVSGVHIKVPVVYVSEE